MKLIFGLGNPGKKYEKTRHNVGFLFLDYLASKYGFSDFKIEKKLESSVAEGLIQGEKMILIKPHTFMNLSGQAVQKAMHFYKIKKEDVWIFYDDKDMEFGKIRFRKSGRSGGHNGIKSILTVLGIDFQRIKIGIQNEFLAKQETSDFVLNNFQKEEQEHLEGIFEEVEECLLEKI